MLSGVNKIARAPSSSARATPIGPPMGSRIATVPISGKRADPPRISAISKTVVGESTSYSGLPRRPPVVCITTSCSPDSLGENSALVWIVTPSRRVSDSSQLTKEDPGPAMALRPPTFACFSMRCTECPRNAATRAASRPATPAPTIRTLRDWWALTYQSGSCDS